MNRDGNVQAVVTAVEVAHAMRDQVRALVAVDLIMDMRDRGLVSLAAGAERSPLAGNPELRRIHARRPGRCARCRKLVAADTPCAWNARTKRIMHLACAAERP
jgi:hypothetical protein